MRVRDGLFTSESVTRGHPDKACDTVSDTVLHAHLTAWIEGGCKGPAPRVACETLIKTDDEGPFVVLAGEITSDAVVDHDALVRAVLRDIGYSDVQLDFDPETCRVYVRINQQSNDIAQGVNVGAGLHEEQGAGDQGMMFGFACDETPALMPLSHWYALRLTDRLTELVGSALLPWLRADAKSQVTVQYEDRRVVGIHTVVISCHHDPDVELGVIRPAIEEHVIRHVLPAELLAGDVIIHVNPTGRFVTGGPLGDAGVTGRKIIVDTYGGHGAHGGGAFSGKDPSKVDRSATYMARLLAKHLVGAGLATIAEVQLAYAIGVAQPVSVAVDTHGTGVVDDDILAGALRAVFDLRPAAILETLGLLSPEGWTYPQTASGGHFGRDFLPWEQLTHVDDLVATSGWNG